MINSILRSKLKEAIFIIIFSAILLMFFISTKYVGTLLFRTFIQFFLGILISIIFFALFKNKFSNTKIIPSNKASLAPFLITIFVGVIISIYQIKTNFSLNRLQGVYVLIVIAFNILTLFTCYFFKLKLNDFNWNISLIQILIIITIFTGYFIPKLIFSGVEAFRFYSMFHGNVLAYVVSGAIMFIQPALYEEVIYRGFLISALKGFGLDDFNINVVQAIIFGLLHFSIHIQYGWIGVLGTSSQILLGFILGKIYIKSKSLMPCIILHLLIDIV